MERDPIDWLIGLVDKLWIDPWSIGFENHNNMKHILNQREIKESMYNLTQFDLIIDSLTIDSLAH